MIVLKSAFGAKAGPFGKENMPFMGQFLTYVTHLWHISRRKCEVVLAVANLTTWLLGCSRWLLGGC